MTVQMTRHINEDGEATDYLLIRNVRTSFLRVFKPEFNDLKERDVFSVDLLMPKDTDMTVMLALAKELKIREWKDENFQMKQKTIKDGDAKVKGEKYQDYAGHHYITPWNYDRPDIINGLKEEITEATEFQSGDFCNVFVQMYTYGKKGNTGIAFSLETIQKTNEGDRMGGGMSKSARRGAFETEVYDI